MGRKCYWSSPGRIRTVDRLCVGQVPSPLGHRTVCSFLLTCFRVERRPWDSNPQVFRPAVFKTASSPIRVTSVKPSTGDRNRTCDLLVQSQTQLPTVATLDQLNDGQCCLLRLLLARGEGFEPSSPDSKSGSLPLADPRIGCVESVMRGSNPPIQLGKLAPLPIGQWHLTSFTAEGEGVEPPRQLRSPSFERDTITHWLVLPFCKLRRQESNLQSPA